MRRCGEVETTGKTPAEDERFQKMKEEAWRLFERQGRSSRRNSPVWSGTHRATTEESERRWCKSGQVNVKGHPTRGTKTPSQREAEHGTGRFQLPKTTNMGENTGTEDSRPNAAPRTREMSSTSSSLHWSLQWRQPYTRIRFGQYRGLRERREHVVKMSLRCWSRR